MAGTEVWLPLGIVGAGLGIGWALATSLRRQDHLTFVLARAPRLPVRALSAHDDAWLHGKLRAIGAPLSCPVFGHDCVAFEYHRERLVTVERIDANGKPQTEEHWETEQRSSQRGQCELDDGDRIALALSAATIEAWIDLGHRYDSPRRRHHARVLPVDAEVAVLGVRGDDGTFGPLAEVPLLITAHESTRRVRNSARSETALLVFAVLAPMLGVGIAAALVLPGNDAASLPIAVAIGAFVGALQWWLLVHNRLLRLRSQVKVCERQVDIELAQRAALVPNLIAVVNGYAAHESSLLQRLAAIRSGADFAARVRAEGDASTTAQSVLLLHERHPELRSAPLYRDLHDRLWAIEEKLAHSRSVYNDVVTEWNDRLEHFPSSLVAAANRHRPAMLFAAEPEATRAPRLG